MNRRDLMATTAMRVSETPEPVRVISAEEAALVRAFYGDSHLPFAIGDSFPTPIIE